jgi:hypothetical protein
MSVQGDTLVPEDLEVHGPSVGAQRGQSGLRTLVFVAMVAPAFGVLLIESAIPFWVRALAFGLWVLCLLPAWLFLGLRPEQRRPLPFLPFIGVLYGVYYPLTVVLGSYGKYSRVNVVPESDYGAPVVLATLGWVSLLLGYLLVQAGTLTRVKDWADEWDPDVAQRWAIWLMWIGIAVQALRMSVGIPIVLGGTVVFLVSVGHFGMGLLTFLVFRYRLRGYPAAMLISGVAAALFVLIATGFLAAIVQPVLVLLFSVWAARQTLSMRWIVLTVVGLCALLAVKSVILEFRALSYVSANAGIPARVGLIWELVRMNAEDVGVLGLVSAGGASVTKRSALMDLFADVVRRTPAQVPYWGGQTYTHLVGSFVPRFLWPSKPVHRLGNEFGHRYGYLDTGDTNTSWNLPTMVEFYVNFGDLAVVVGMFIVGVLYSSFCVLMNRPGQSPLVSIAGVILALMMVNVESDFSLVFGAMAMQGGAIWLVLLLIARASRRHRERAERREARVSRSGSEWVSA